MKAWVAVLLIVVAQFGWSTPADAGTTSKRIKPTSHAGIVKVRIETKKLSTYHKITAEEPLTFSVRGPIAVRILTRCLFRDLPPGGEITYGIHVEIDGVRQHLLVENASVSFAAKLADGGPIGTLERNVLTIPEGPHKVRLYPAEEGVEIAARLFLGLWVSVEPRTHAGAVKMEASDGTCMLYRFSADKPIEATVHGPVTMRIESRLDFSGVLTQSYVLKIYLDDEFFDSDAYETKPSESASYPDLPRITPGRKKTTHDLKIPAGIHRVSVTLEGTTAPGAALRILVPKDQMVPG